MKEIFTSFAKYCTWRISFCLLIKECPSFTINTWCGESVNEIDEEKDKML